MKPKKESLVKNETLDDCFTPSSHSYDIYFRNHRLARITKIPMSKYKFSKARFNKKWTYQKNI